MITYLKVRSRALRSLMGDLCNIYTEIELACTQNGASLVTFPVRAD